MKNLKITLEQAKELHKLPEWKIQIEELYPELSESEVVKHWEDLVYIQGYYVNEESEISQCTNVAATYQQKNIFVSKSYARQSKAIAQLSQIAYRANDNQTEEKWCDWEDHTEQPKFSVYYVEKTKAFCIEQCYVYAGKILFKREQDLKKSLENHKDLWKLALRVN